MIYNDFQNYNDLSNYFDKSCLNFKVILLVLVYFEPHLKILYSIFSYTTNLYCLNDVKNVFTIIWERPGTSQDTILIF